MFYLTICPVPETHPVHPCQIIPYPDHAIIKPYFLPDNLPGPGRDRACKPGLYIVKTNMNSRFCLSACVHVNNPLQKIPPSGQPRGRCARVSKSLQTLSVFNGFRNAILRKHMKTYDFSIANYLKSPSARMLHL